MTQQTTQHKIDYIIVGQGICGTLLSYFLKREEKNILVVDEPKPNSASKVASGVINPITGRRLVRSWMIEDVMPFAVDVYKQLEVELEIGAAGAASTEVIGALDGCPKGTRSVCPSFMPCFRDSFAC